jgi:hypothetical protein
MGLIWLLYNNQFKYMNQEIVMIGKVIPSHSTWNKCQMKNFTLNLNACMNLSHIWIGMEDSYNNKKEIVH